MQRIYIAIDLKSFYASVECRERGLDRPDRGFRNDRRFGRRGLRAAPQPGEQGPLLFFDAPLQRVGAKAGVLHQSSGGIIAQKSSYTNQ